MGAPATSAGQTDVTRAAGAATTGAPASRVLACTAGGRAPSIAAIAWTPSTAATGTSTAPPGGGVVVSSHTTARATRGAAPSAGSSRGRKRDGTSTRDAPLRTAPATARKTRGAPATTSPAASPSRAQIGRDPG